MKQKTQLVNLHGIQLLKTKGYCKFNTKFSRLQMMLWRIWGLSSIYDAYDVLISKVTLLYFVQSHNSETFIYERETWNKFSWITLIKPDTTK